MEQQVWAVILKEQEALSLMDTYIISNVHQQGASIELRIVSIEKPHPEAINVLPKLEDMYVFYFGNPH